MAAVWVNYAQLVLPAPVPESSAKAATKDKGSSQYVLCRCACIRPTLHTWHTAWDHRPRPTESPPAAQEQLLHMVLAALRLSTRLQEPFVGAGACSPPREPMGACRRLTLPLSNSPASSAGTCVF